MTTSTGSAGAAARRVAPAPSQRAPRRGRVLLVGAPWGGRARLSRALARYGYQTVAVNDGAEALVRLRRGDFRAMVLADELPGIPGHALLPGLRVAWPELPVILVRRPGHVQGGAEAMANGARACLVSPVRASALLRALVDAESGSPEAAQASRRAS
jgi:DNA-binding NtrC family response regulator